MSKKNPPSADYQISPRILETLAQQQTDSYLAASRSAASVLDELEKAKAELLYWQRADPEFKPSEMVIKQDKLFIAESNFEAANNRYLNVLGNIYHPSDAVDQPNCSPVDVEDTCDEKVDTSNDAEKPPSKKKRRDALDPVIEHVQKKCIDPFDFAEVWNYFERLADDEFEPLLAATDKGIKYKKNGKTSILTRRALHNRLSRIKTKDV